MLENGTCRNGFVALGAALLLCSAARGAAPGDVLINEIDYDQAGTDAAEFIEITNVTGGVIDLSTFQLQLINGTGGGATVYDTITLSGTLAAGGYYVVCGDAGNVPNCDLDVTPNTNLIQNGAPDAVAVFDGAVLIDTVSYEGDTGIPFTEGSGVGLEDDSTVADSGLSRCPDGTDTDMNNVDLIFTAITPGAANDCTPPAPELVINEIDYDQAGTDAAEFVEIKNIGASSADLSGIELQLINGSTSSAYDTIALSGTLAAGDYYVVCANAATVANCDLDDGPDTNFIQNGAPDAVALFDGATLLDTVSYEGDTAGFTEGSGVGLEDDPNVADSGISRCPDGADTDMNNVDLTFVGISPGASNDCAGPAPVLVINEIDYDQDGTDAAEFIEIKNIGASSADLSGIELQLINGSTSSAYDTIALSGTLAAGDYYVVCANAATVANCDLDDGPDTNFIQNGAPDAVALFDGATLLDTVSYEGDTTGFTEGSGVGLEDDPNVADSGISRCPDGADTDMNNVDLTFTGISPGASNDCPVPGGLVINEIDYDQDGTDDAEFVEIKNTSAVPVDLAGFSLEFINGSSVTIYDTIALPAVTLAAGDYFVVCANAATVFDCDLDDGPDTNFIQNGAPDAVALLFGGGIVDTVSYEGDVAGFVEGSGSGLEDDSNIDNSGISRFPDGADTDMNNVDLSPRCITPGAANSADVGSCPVPGPPQLVVNEIDYDQPGADFAEFVEIFNAGNGDADLTGVTLELVNGSDSLPYDSVALPSVTLASGDYFVVCADALAVPECDLEGFSSIQNGAPDAVALMFDGGIVDTVSYEGDVTGFVEGSGAGLEDSGLTGEDNKGISRLPNGVDSDMNNVDLTFVCVTPGRPNSSQSSGCGAGGPVFEIFEIQGAGASVLFEDESVATVDNIVTAVGPDGFFIQTPDARSDADVDTSDGIFVFTGGAPTVAVGDSVDVTGTATEFFAFSEIGGFPTVSVNSAGNPLPSIVTFNATVPSPDPNAPSCAIEFECYEGMRVEIVGGAVTGPNQGFGTDPIAEVHITAAPTRTFREPGIEFPGEPGFPIWDGNPEVFEMDPDALGLPNDIIPGGSSFDAEGVIGFEFGGYELFPTSLTVTPAVVPDPVRMREPGEFTVGSLNLFRLFDDVDDPSDVNFFGDTRDDTVVDALEYATRRAKFASYIVDVLDSPDILAVQEAEKLGVLQDLAADITALDATVIYTAHLLEGNDVGTIDVGFLVRDTVIVDTVTQLGLTETYINPVDGMPDVLNDRPPLQIEARCQVGGVETPVTVIVVHGRSLSGIDDSDGRVRKKRYEQAQSLAQKIQDLQVAEPLVNLVVVGDFNAFEFSDGYVDVVGQIKGDFVPADNFICLTETCDDLVDPNLTNLIDTIVPVEERYSFIFSGNAQVLDHALVTEGALPLVSGAEYGRGNADGAEELINDDSTPVSSSDHDGLVVFLMKDSDGDKVADVDDLCPGSEIPENVAQVGLGPNRYGLIDGDTLFDKGTPASAIDFTTADTGGCNCKQIAMALGIAGPERNMIKRYGCRFAFINNWVNMLSAVRE